MKWRPGTNHIFVDVDGTLLLWPTIPGSPKPGEVPKVNDALVKSLLTWCKRTGGKIVIWTQRGVLHAEMAKRLCGLHNAICLPKPECIIDDAAAVKWARRTPVLSPEEFSADINQGYSA